MKELKYTSGLMRAQQVLLIFLTTIEPLVTENIYC